MDGRGDGAPGLTIGQLADYAGVTVRAVRHYHQRGLLAEPGRDASGYRRYDAQAVLDLVRIRILADSGAPLGRVAELVDAGPEAVAAAVAEIDGVLARQIRELRARRRRLADLAAGERGILPPELVGLLDDLTGAGIGPRTVQIEKEGWLLMLARSPVQARRWLDRKRRDLRDPDLLRVYRAYDEAASWSPDDRRLAGLADELVSHLAGTPADDDGDPALHEPVMSRLVDAHFAAQATPATRRLADLVAQRLSTARG